jgi:hypothetical protein
MTEDPIVAEIRKVRHAHAEKFNNDIAAICADYRRMEKESGDQYITFPPRRLKAPQPSANDSGNTTECAS